MKYYIDKNGKYLGGSDNKPLSGYEATYAPDDARMIWDGSAWNVPEPTKEEVMQAIAAALQNVLDVEAQKLGYDNINTSVSYADEPSVPSFQSDGQSFRAWRSNVWAYAYSTLATFEADVAQYAIDKPLYNQYLLDKAQYDIDYAQWQIDVVNDTTLVEPVAPVVVTQPTAPVQPTEQSMVANMPVRV